MNYKLEINDTQYKNALTYFRKNTRSVTRMMVGRMAQRAMKKIAEKISGTGHFRTHPTGQLMQQLGTRQVSDTTAEIHEDAIYGAIHEYGGDIYPVKAKMLAFQIDGEWIFTRHVFIPARPYFHPTIEKYLESEQAKVASFEDLQEVIDKAVANGN